MCCHQSLAPTEDERVTEHAKYQHLVGWWVALCHKAESPIEESYAILIIKEVLVDSPQLDSYSPHIQHRENNVYRK